MNSKLWIRKALSTCLAVATIATYSMVALAGSERVAGELLVSGNNMGGQAPAVKVNGETAQSGRSVFSSSTVATPENASAIINLGKIGRIELAPNTILALSFDDKGINGDLLAGRLTVLSAADAVNVKTTGGKMVKLSAGESATSGQQTKDKDDDDNDDHHGGGAGLLWALVLGGAIAGIIIAARSDNNRVSIGGTSTILSPRS